MLSLIVAMTENGVIGRGGDMPWRMSDDLRRFKRITLGHHIVMGRKTYDSIGRPLPGRTSIVISRQATYADPQVRAARSLDEALQLASGDHEVFITGGSQIFAMALPHVDRMYLTRIHCELDGDTHFPDVDWSRWRLIEQQTHRADDRNQYDYSFQTYERVSDA